MKLQQAQQVERHDQAGEHNGNGGNQLDEDVQRRTGSILEGIADGIANDSCLMLLAALAAVVDSQYTSWRYPKRRRRWT